MPEVSCKKTGHCISAGPASFRPITGSDVEIVQDALGSLTTFSAFSLEAVALLQGERYGWAMTLIGTHLIGSLAMTLLGIFVVRALAA